MEKNRLNEISKDSRFINGIYNYCDRWCERCPQTYRCLNYTIVKKEFTELETQDIHNAAFWKNISGILEEALDLIKENAAAEGIDLDAIGIVPEEADCSILEATENHEISRTAREYSRMVEDWFNEEEGFFVKTEEEDTDSLPLEDFKRAFEDDDMQEALEVVRWYQHQIYVKLIRALSGRMEEASAATQGPDEYAKDSDGSIKVALIGIDRSIAAWGIISNSFPSFKRQSIRSIIMHLDKLRRRIEKDFPDARGFIRPGFDVVDLNS